MIDIDRRFPIPHVNHLAFSEFICLTLIVPFALFPTPERFLIFLALPVLWMMQWWVTHHFVPRTPLDLSLFGLSLMILVSLYASYDIAISLPGIAALVFGIAFFYTVVLWAQTRRRLWIGILVFGILGFVISLAGLFGTRWGSKVPGFASVVALFPPRLLGVVGIDEGVNPNVLAGTLLWVLPLALLLARFVILKGWLRRKTFLSVTIFLLAFVTSGVFILTQSRGGYIAFAITALCLFVVFLPTKRYQLIAVGLLVVLILVGAVIAYSNRDVFDRLLKNGDAADAALSLDTLEGRVEIWSRALYGIEDFPFTGMGMNTFRKIVHVLYPLFLINPDQDIGHAHNEFLQAALDLGIPGLIAFISLYLVAFWMLIQIWRGASGDDRELTKTLVLGLGGGLFAHLLFGLTDAVIFAAKPAILFWMLLGLIAALYKSSSEKKILIH
ncbi:MAG: O-antigen ligase family protein [Nitrospirae bacterium]|nr:O-antigen ligase family protein [Nitrospirota bacterium]